LEPTSFVSSALIPPPRRGKRSPADEGGNPELTGVNAVANDRRNIAADSAWLVGPAGWQEVVMSGDVIDFAKHRKLALASDGDEASAQLAAIARAMPHEARDQRLRLCRLARQAERARLD
jgi:hypothetical protein